MEFSKLSRGLDGKHIRIEKLPNTGSSNFNYKSYHSIVLLGCCDADGMFTMIETGYAGRNSDGGIFRASIIKRMLCNSQLDIPPPFKLPLDDYDNRSLITSWEMKLFHGLDI